MNDTVTILGRVGGDPNRSQTTSGVPVLNFRVASPQRRFDQKTQSWIETGTNWYNVSAFRQLAEHAKASLRSGDGVIVTGRLKLREWESGGKKGMSVDIDADAIGHDLRWGASAYVKARTASSSQPPQTVDQQPQDDGIDAPAPADDTADDAFEERPSSSEASEFDLANGWKSGD
jgi:single-strand DNA-binding protein